METTEIILKKITPKEGFLLTDGEITTNALFMKNIPATNVYWEIPDPDYIPEFDGADFLRPITYTEGINVVNGLWYTDGDNVWDAHTNGIPAYFGDPNYFNIIVL